MNFEHITAEEWAAVRKVHMSPRTLSDEAKAALSLLPGNGVKFPCRWKHNPKTKSHGILCSGGASITHACKRHGITVRCTCKDGVLYVWRPAGETA